jgi:hypothetical protein
VAPFLFRPDTRDNAGVTRLPLILGLLFLALGTLLVWVNVYTSFVRYPLHRLRGGTREDFRWVSGVPLVGIFVLMLAVICFGRQYLALTWTAIVIAALDTSGPHWLAGFLLFNLLFQRRKRGA